MRWRALKLKAKLNNLHLSIRSSQTRIVRLTVLIAANSYAIGFFVGGVYISTLTTNFQDIFNKSFSRIFTWSSLLSITSWNTNTCTWLNLFARSWFYNATAVHGALWWLRQSHSVNYANHQHLPDGATPILQFLAPQKIIWGLAPILVRRCKLQGGHSSGKPGKVRELKSG